VKNLGNVARRELLAGAHKRIEEALATHTDTETIGDAEDTVDGSTDN